MIHESISKPKYGLIDSGLFGFRIVAGIVTGIRFTEDKPVFEISFGKDKWWTTIIADDIQSLFGEANIATLERIQQTHGLKIKYNS